jgi:hypothetical protein
MNRITDKLKIGTIGELLVQLRLLEHGVQAAPPIKDSGNDLIAVKNESFRAIQVRTTTGDTFDKPNPDRKYHILAVVQLVDDETQIYLDKSSIFLIPRNQVEKTSTRIRNLEQFRITNDSVKQLFDQNEMILQQGGSPDAPKPVPR